jgi:outer membrane lipoprotein-sorting protein
MSPRRLLLLLCLVLCAVALTGCAAHDALSLDPVAQAASKTASSTSSRFVFSASIDAGAMGQFSFHGNGMYDGPTKRGWMNMHFTLPLLVQEQLGTSDPSMEMIFDGHSLVMYMRSAMFRTVAPGTWVKMDLKELAKKEGQDLGALMNANQADPSQALKVLMASSNARPLGKELVRGVATTRYSFQIDFDRLVHDNKALDQFKAATGMSSIPAQAWVDAQGRIRRLNVQMSMGAQLGTPMTMTMSEELYDFGVRTNIDVPTGSMVTDLSALAGASS